jgi:HD-like signal output (HDOD) protein
MKNLHDLVTKKIRLPSPPVIAMRIIDMVRQDHFSFEDIGDIIRTDPALAARILRVANSPYYTLGQKIASIEMALLVLGTNVVKNIALSVVIWSATKQDGKNFDFDLYWRRAVTAAVAADLTSAAVGLNDPDIFVPALLQDIGVLIFIASCPGDYHLVLNAKTATQKPLSEMERHFFGFDHQQLGAVLLESWHLPEEIYLPILYHHNNDKLPDKHRSRIEI